MGNVVSPCLLPNRRGTVKLVFWGGAVMVLPKSQPAGELLFEYPDHVICQADSFFIGRPVPALGLHDELIAGKTYFVVPSIASRRGLRHAFGESPFEYMKDAHERTIIRVNPEFIARIMSEGSGGGGGGGGDSGGGGNSSPLCTTPELQKHYAQLVGPREQQWSPKLETISERRARLSPSRILGFDIGR
ncbi:unnamed protein product [Spirodela intermedia]|uniref:Uncharacterized protein n=1 Tax=Spirodela intermedia TaxID=51605 RepID=A0A7I8J0F6_SPIIN|nr:unnamed protein product [Spirodela intermedia]CAA6663529.1 unnamed protein product [Spirodela intermedia]